MLTDNAIEILRARYLVRDEAGEVVETPAGMFRRVARAVAMAEGPDRSRWEERFFRLMEQGEFLPNSPTLMNAGLPEGQLSACFVLPVGDSMEAIFECLRQTALIHQSGGGTGFNFSSVRPRGDRTGSGPGTASGPLAFMQVFDEATRQVRQGGRRRGANMGVLECTHPDVMAFVRSKEDPSRLQNFNLSVGVTDLFMKAVERGDTWALYNPRDGKLWGELPARELWAAIGHQAWKRGDPGLLFLDAINAGNTVPAQGRLLATNPCGELPLYPFESCNLGSVNLRGMLRRDAQGHPGIDWDRLGSTVRTGLRFLDDVISVNRFLLPEVREATLANRKVGLGVMGWAELLIELGIPYASEQAVALARKVMGFIRDCSYEASEDLARERGPFPNWPGSVFYPKRPLRNASCNSVAPTGSISVIAGTSYSIEPLYALSFKRVGILEGETQWETNPVAHRWLLEQGHWTPALEKHLRDHGGISGYHGVSKRVGELLATAHEIPWEYHLAHQQAFQEYTDNAVSKTVNLPGETPESVVSEVYWRAWELGLKGITVYRDGSRAGQVLQHCSRSGPCEG